MPIPTEDLSRKKLTRELGSIRPDDYYSPVNAPWPGCSAVGVDSYNPGEDLLSDPHNFHSNPGYLGTTTAGSLQAAQPGSIYRQTGGGEGHRPMTVGGPARTRVAGHSVSPRGTRTVPPAGPAREPVSEGSPLVVTTGGSQW